MKALFLKTSLPFTGHFPFLLSPGGKPQPVSSGCWQGVWWFTESVQLEQRKGKREPLKLPDSWRKNGDRETAWTFRVGSAGGEPRIPQPHCEPGVDLKTLGFLKKPTHALSQKPDKLPQGGSGKSLGNHKPADRDGLGWGGCRTNRDSRTARWQWGRPQSRTHVRV